MINTLKEIRKGTCTKRSSVSDTGVLRAYVCVCTTDVKNRIDVN